MNTQTKRLIEIAERTNGVKYSQMNLSLNDLIMYFTETESFVDDLFLADKNKEQDLERIWRKYQNEWVGGYDDCIFSKFVGDSFDYYIQVNCDFSSTGVRLFWGLIPFDKKEEFFLFIFNSLLD